MTAVTDDASVEAVEAAVDALEQRVLTAFRGRTFPAAQPDYDAAMAPVYAARAALTALREKDGWRPIGEAPRDGTLLLLWEPHSEGGFAFVGAYSDLTEVWFNNLDLQVQSPTHFRPLPAAPDAGEALTHPPD